MDLNKLAQQLQDTEVEILRAFQKNKTERLEGVQGMTQIEFLRAGMWLENKNLVEKKKKVLHLITLDKLGKQYAKTSLPELKLLSLLKKRDLLLEEAEKHLTKDELRFAVGYLKQRGFVLLEKGLLSITDAGKRCSKTLEQEFLNKLLKEGEIEVEKLAPEERHAFLNLRRRRQIIKEFTRTTIILKLTPTGKKILSHLPKGKSVGVLTAELIKSGRWKTLRFRRYDVSAGVPAIYFGKKQPYRTFLDRVKQELLAMGFQEMTGPLVEAAFFNNDALFMPQDHPARGIHDIYFVKGEAKLDKYKKFLSVIKKAHESGSGTGSLGWRYKFSVSETKKLLLRSQGTALSARMLMNPKLEIPGKYFAIARCYRPDTVDWKHLTEFNQLEGIVLGKDVNFRHLLGLLADFAKRIAGVSKVRFVPGYFPFTEPSVEGYIYLKELGQWVEALPAGIFRPEVTQPLGIKVPVLAWGIGIDRLFMAKEGIKDIRQLFSSDLKWLREAKL